MLLYLTHPPAPVEEAPHLSKPPVPRGQRYTPLHDPAQIAIDVVWPHFVGTSWETKLVGRPQEQRQGLPIRPHRIRALSLHLARQKIELDELAQCAPAFSLCGRAKTHRCRRNPQLVILPPMKARVRRRHQLKGFCLSSSIARSNLSRWTRQR